jgi:hypothetical protein
MSLLHIGKENRLYTVTYIIVKVESYLLVLNNFELLIDLQKVDEVCTISY